MSDLPSLPGTPLGRYRQYKGGDYEVIGVVRHDGATSRPKDLHHAVGHASDAWPRRL